MPRNFLQFPVIYQGAEYLVMGHLMRRNILTYNASLGNEGYDLICIHPDQPHRPCLGELAQSFVEDLRAAMQQFAAIAADLGADAEEVELAMDSDGGGGGESCGEGCIGCCSRNRERDTG